ncbi:MAG: hypothetical protein JEZ14_16330 [Marinilabiliaceae bacterium]|nr:hypothetical protein [Marinilabiliaceae bacterium]
MKALQSKSSATKSLPLIIGVLFLSFSLFAQAGFKSEVEFTEPELEIEKWMTDVDAFESTHEESDLKVETWMTNLDDFYNTYEEPLLAIDSWMTNLDKFDALNEEPMLAVESWMTDSQEFKNFTQVNPELLFAEATEKSLSIENWMINIDDFENYSQDDLILLADEPIEIEGWMVSLEEFHSIPTTKIPTLNNIDLEEHAPVLIALHTSSK